MSVDEITLDKIETARKNINSTIHPTPIIESTSLSQMCGTPIFLKLEHQQLTGSFKLRGATNAILNLNKDQKSRGVVGLSTGNHGRGLAYSARLNGIKCIICMSSLVPKNKIDGIKAQGAEVRIIGQNQDDAQEEVDRLVREENMTLIPPFDHPDIIAGQGTLGLEINEFLPELENAIVPLSGGGLISGVAKALKSKNPKCKIIGVSMERGAAMYECQKAGRPIFVKEEKTLADALGGGIGLDNEYTFNMTRDLVDDIILVSESEIASGVKHAYWQEKQIVEGSGAVAIAALISRKISPKGTTIALMCGSNIDLNTHHRIISGISINV
mgnify:CR=1 FL=1